jgi:phospholipid/cholesterol/gamma-HCH transport system ATP-binding protein
MSTEPGRPRPPRRDPGGPPAVRVSGLRAVYGDRTVLEDVSFDVRPGEVFAVLGGSGSGKSTLLKHLIGLMQPAAGTVELSGQDLARAAGPDRTRLLRGFGVLFQSGALFSSMTVEENVALALEEATELGPAAVRTVARLKLALVELSGHEDDTPAQLSGGMRKRAAMARALALDPAILFLDEPSAGLDPITSAGIDQLVLDLRAALGTTMVLVTHELASVMRVADRCIVLDGRRRTVVAEGRPQELAEHDSDPYVRAFFHREPLPDAQDGAGRAASTTPPDDAR